MSIRLKFIFISILLFGCSSKNDPNTFVIAFSSDIRGFDPAFATDLRTGKIVSLLYDNLVRFDESMELIPSLASKWETNDIGTEYTFHIKENCEFHDGEKITADDVIFSFKRVLSSDTHSPQTWLLDKIKGADHFMSGRSDDLDGLYTPNEFTVIIELNEPFAPFLQYLAMPSTAIVNKKQIGSIKTTPAGSGPWKLAEWERDGKITLVSNNDYWGDEPSVEKMEIRILSETMTQSAEFESGSLDILEIPPGELTFWEQRGHDLTHVNELNIWYVGMNCSREPYNDIRVRKAMNYAVDREKIIQMILNNTAVIANGPVPPQLTKALQTQYYPYDPKRAIKLLDDAGYPNGLRAELHVAGGSGMFQVLEALQSDWASVGIDVQIKRSDWNVFKTSVKEGKPDLYYLDWFADYPDGENFLYPLFHSKESMKKRNRFSDSTIDKMIEEIQQMAHGNERDILIDKTNALIADKAPWVFLWHSKTMYLKQDDITGFSPSPIFNANRYTGIKKRS